MSEISQSQPRAWYIIHTYSGYEDKVRASLERAMPSAQYNGKMFQILLPTEDVVEVKKNKKSIRKRKFFPGYLLIDMLIDHDTYWLVRNTPGVTDFLGGAKPTPLADEEVRGLIDMAASAPQAKPKAAIEFEVGQHVRINEGPFKHFVGAIEEINNERAKVKVVVSIFGRGTPVELDFLQVEKVS